MRVLHLIAPGPLAGAERVVLAGCRALRSAGVDLVLGALVDARHPGGGRDFLDAARAAGLEPVPFLSRGRVDLRTVRALRRHASGGRYDLFHVHGYKALAYAALAHGEVPLLATDHGQTSQSVQVRLYEATMRRMYRLVDRVVAVSEPGRGALLRGGLRPERVVTVPNFLTRELAGPATGDVRSAGEAARLLVLGRLSPEKGVDVLIQALARRAAGAARLTVVGDGPERRRLEQLTADLGLSARVEFVGYRDDVGPFLRAADALVMPSHREGLPLTLVEALAAGLPVVASDVGGVGELVRDGDNGRLVPPGDVAALAGALGDVAGRLSDFRRVALGDAARVRRRHSPQAWATATAEIYAQTLTRRAA